VRFAAPLTPHDTASLSVAVDGSTARFAVTQSRQAIAAGRLRLAPPTAPQ